MMEKVDTVMDTQKEIVKQLGELIKSNGELKIAVELISKKGVRGKAGNF